MTETLTFADGLKDALGVDRATPAVFVGNFEVEEVWAEPEFVLPRLSSAGARAVVNRMDEFAILLGGPGDVAVTKSAPDPDYLDYLHGLGLPLPSLLHPRDQDPARPVTADVLADPALLERLRDIGSGVGSGVVVAHGVSDLEEQLVRSTGLALAAPGAATCKAVNSKNYSRDLADRHGVPQPAGRSCTSLAQFADALQWAETLRAQGRGTVVKEAYGVSGKGIAALSSPRRGERIHGVFAAQARRAGIDRTAVVVEEWVDKRVDLNYQLTVGRDGTVTFDFVKEAITANGVHRGHRLPARLTDRQLDDIRRCAAVVGAQLHADGYYGVAGVDALITTDDVLYPLIEINARNNMSTYQVPLQQRFVRDGQCAMARHYAIRADRQVGFAELHRLLAAPLDDRSFVVNNFATVNAGAGADGAIDGRLYGLLVGADADTVDALDAEIDARLSAWSPR